MLLDNPFKHRRIALSIPGALGVDDRNRSTFANTQTVRLRSENTATSGETELLQPLLEVVPGAQASLFVTAFGIGLVAAEQNVTSGSVDPDRNRHTPLAGTATSLGSWLRHRKPRSIARTPRPDRPESSAWQPAPSHGGLVQSLMMRLMRWYGAALLVLTVGSLDGTGLEPAPESASISAADLRRDVFVLASDGMGGRLVGSPGNRQAAQFIAARFEELGLAAVGADRGYLHRFDLIIPSLGTGNRLTVTSGSRRSSVSLGPDFYPERFSGTGWAEGHVVFAGFGISAPSLGHDDYGNADVSNGVVMVLDHEPGEWDAESLFDGEATSEHARSVRKALEAQSRGAAAVLLVADVHNHSTPRSLIEGMRHAWPQEPRRVPDYELAARGESPYS